MVVQCKNYSATTLFSFPAQPRPFMGLLSKVMYGFFLQIFYTLAICKKVAHCKRRTAFFQISDLGVYLHYSEVNAIKDLHYEGYRQKDDLTLRKCSI